MTKFQKPNSLFSSGFAFVCNCNLGIGDWNLFVFWILLFGIFQYGI
jgi:hypothetical protein